MSSAGRRREPDDSSRELRADVLACRERIPDRKVRKAGAKVRIEKARVRTFGWTADIELAPDRLMKAVRAGRARWKVRTKR